MPISGLVSIGGGGMRLSGSGGGSGFSAAKAPANSRILFVGDSNTQYSTFSAIGASPEHSTSLRGIITWAGILDQRFRADTWRQVGRVYGPYIGTTGTLGSNPFSTTNASATVTVTHTGHGLATGANYLGGAEYHFSGAVTFNGVNLNGGYRVITVPDANTFTITANTTATATSTGGGAAVVFRQRPHAVVDQNTGPGANWGVSGDHVQGGIDVMLNEVNLPSSGTARDVDCGVIVVALGTNNINSSNSTAVVQGHITRAVSAALSHPNTPNVILCTVPPRGVPRTRTLPNNPFTTINASNIVTISDPGHPYDSGQTVTFTGASAVNGLTLTGPYTIRTQNFNADSYEIQHGSTASGSGSGGGTGVTSVNASTNLIYPVNDARWTVLKEVNDWIKATNWGPRVQVADIASCILDTTTIVNTTSQITGAALDFTLIDGVHFTPRGAYLMAKNGFLPALNTVMEAGVGTWFEQDPTVADNFAVNGPLTGTGGLVSTGTTGTLPDRWIALRSAGSSVTGVVSKVTLATGIDGIQAVLTSAGSSGFDTYQIRPANSIAYNRVSTATSLTFNTLTSGLNPTVRVTHSSLTNGHPIVGSQVTFANASGTINGVTLNGTWTISAVSNNTTSTCTYDFVATGQTASATGSGAITIDTTYSAANLIPTNSWIRVGGYISVPAWDKIRNVQMFLQTRNVSTGVLTYRVGRTYNSSLRIMPTEAYAGWWLSDPLLMDSTALASVTNILFQCNIDVENSTTGTTTGTFVLSRPFIRVITDPRPEWSIAT